MTRSLNQLLDDHAAKKLKAFKLLLDDLTHSYGIEDRDGLAAIINDAASAYEGTRYWADEAKRVPDTRYKLAKPLAGVIDLLMWEGNWLGMWDALGGGRRAVGRLDAICQDLDKIRRTLPPPPPKRKRGKPIQTRDLHALVDCLATYWEKATKKPFTQLWHTEPNGRRAPIAPATSFVYAVVEFIDEKRLRALPKVTEKIVSESRAATSRK